MQLIKNQSRLKVDAGKSASNLKIALSFATALMISSPIVHALDGDTPIRPGFDSNTLPANDDRSTGLVPLGFPINFFGSIFNDGYVNNNGNMTFDSSYGSYTPSGIANSGRIIIAPFFADVLTSQHGNPVTYGQGTVGSQPAFAANWVDVGCYATTNGGLNSFQMVLIGRSDIGEGDFDIEFNYQQIVWETGQASGGSSTCQGGTAAEVGYSNGTDTSFELAGSRTVGAFLDTNETTGLIHNNRNSLVPGRYLFEIRNGGAPIGQHIAGTIFGDNTDNPLPESLVQICTTDQMDMLCNLTRSNILGQYLIGGLLDADYEVTAFPPAGSNFQPASIGPIMLSGADLNGQDIVLQGPQPLPNNTTVEPSRTNNSSGEPTIYWNDTLALTTEGCAGGIASYTVTHNGTGQTIASGNMQEDVTTAGTYSADIPPLAPNSGHSTVAMTIDCPVGEDQVTEFSMYIDPSGVVIDTLGNPIEGATVTLFRSDSATGLFVQVPDQSAIMSPTNRTNPDLTNDQGLFGWDVIAGFYTVRAAAEGCVSPADSGQNFVETAVMDIPPEVTDIELVLACGDAPVFGVCDVNQDSIVTRADIMLIYGTLRSTVPADTSGDFTGDGIISTQDVRGCMTQMTPF